MNYTKIVDKINKIRFMLIWDGIKRANFLRKKKLLDNIGEKVIFQSRNFPMDPKLVRIHNNVVIAANVYFVTHDAIRHVLVNKNKKKYQINMGPIEIMDNVFVGLGTIILPNVRIGENTIIAAGSLVNKSIPGNGVYGGIPIRKIKDFTELEKEREQILNRYGDIDYDNLVKEKWKEFDNLNKDINIIGRDSR